MVASSSSSGATRAAAKNSMTPSTVPGAADREGEGGVQARGVGGPRARQRARMLGRRRRSTPACPSATPRRAGPAPGASVTDRLASAKAATARGVALPRVRAAQGRAVVVERRPEGAEVPPQRRADGGQQARVRVVLVGRRGQHARHRVLRAQEHGDVGSLGARGHDRRRQGTASLPHPMGRRTHRASWTGALSVRAGAPTTSSRRPTPVSRSTLPARPLPMTATKRAPVSRTCASARSSQETVKASAEVTRSRSATTVTTRPGLQRHLQRGVERLARGQVELAPQLDHRGHAHPVHGASEQRAGRSWDLVTVDAHG